MKKKFINGLLMAALFAGFTSSMVSCKDYDDEKLNNIESVLASNDATLRQLLAAQKTELEGKISDLETALNACKASCASFQEQINSKLNDYLTIAAWNVYKAEIDGKLQNVYTKDEINALIGDFLTEEQIKALIASGNYVTEDQLNGKLAELEALINQKASVESIIDLLNAGDNSLTQALNSYFNPVIESYVKNNSITEAAVKELIEQAMTGAVDSDAVKALIAEYMEGKTFGLDSDAVKALIAEALVGVNASINQAAADAAQALQLANSNKVAIENLNKVVEGLTNSVIDLGAKISQVQADAAAAKAEAEANRALINNLQSNYNELLSKVEAVQGDVTTIKAMVDDVNENIAALEATVEEQLAKADELHRQVLETISGLASSIDAQNATLGTFKTQIEGMQEQLDVLSEAVAVLLEAIGGDSSLISKIMGTFENTMAKFISDIEINGTYNPLYGYFNTPFDVRSNLLFAFHGNSGDGIRFPTDNPDYYALPASEQWTKITEGDIEMLGGDLTKVKGYLRRGSNVDIIADDGKAGNAGTIYLTVNPTERDFSGTEFTLINSLNEQSPVTIEPLVKGEKLLTMGYTRAEQSPNGFYEAMATLKVEDIDKVRLNTDFAGLKDVARDIKNFRNGIELMNLAQTIYNNINQLLQAQAVKATWTDDFGQKSVVSQYAIGATTLKPLSYSFLKEFKYDDYAGKIISRAETYLDRLMAKVNFALPEMKNVNFTITHIDVPEFDENDAKWTIHFTEDLGTKTGAADADVTVTLPHLYYEDADGVQHEITTDGGATGKTHVVVNVEVGTIEITYNLADMISELYGELTDPMTKVNDMLDDINGFVDDINDYLSEINNINIDNIKADVKDEVMKVINTINRRIARVMKPNKFLQPIMLVRTSEGYSRLSESGYYSATIAGGTKVTLVPTSYNAEILSPAYKKFVAVTNVINGDQSAQGGNADCKNVLDKANAQDKMAEVIDGSVKLISLELTPGYLYEVLYTAVDYSGYVVTKKCYLRLK